MKLLIFSDSHEVLASDFARIKRLDHNSFDLIVYLGDIQEDLMAMINGFFPNKKKIGIRGNHDPYELERLGTMDLHRKEHVIDEISFLGFEGSRRYKDSFSPAFPLYAEDEVFHFMKDLGGCDILLTHTSPHGINEREDRNFEGFKVFNDYILANKPAYVFHGHQHRNKETIMENGTRVIGLYGYGIYDIFEMRFLKKHRWGE